jgi:Protein of unknown function DUF262/Protein of unknown function (DUF1524)
MENTTHSLENLFKLSSFSIPQYQRAYAWEEEPHLTAFLTDLRQQAAAQLASPEKDYFLGTLLLHQLPSGKVHVVDGQQRMTTSVIFIAAALRHHSKVQVFKSERIKEKALRSYFQTIEEDNPFFRSHILGLSSAEVTEDSPSSVRLMQALDFFCKSVESEEWEGLVYALITAKVMVYSVSNSADATLIFELQNDRGKKLTDLEALKSYLMHLVYLHAKSPDDSLGEIQTQFAKIYRTVEALGGIGRSPTEDAVLSFHCASYLSWSGDEWRDPKKLIKKTVRNFDAAKNVTQWVLDFACELRETYRTVQIVLERRDDFPEFAELFLLDRMASFWPTVIKSYRADGNDDKSRFRLACRLMEVYAMRGYGLSNLRSDAGQPSLFKQTRDFNGGFTILHTFLHSMSGWYDINTRFTGGLERQGLYHSNRKDVQYLLWRYENSLRSRRGRSVEHLSWRQYLQPRDNRSKLSIEHIAAQNNPISETKVKWEEKDEPEDFGTVATHRLGNLVLDSISANSSKGKYDFSDKLEGLSKDSTFLSQGELIDWSQPGANQLPEWTLESIKARQSHLIAFAKDTWDPSTYFVPVHAPVAEEDIEDEVQA